MMGMETFALARAMYSRYSSGPLREVGGRREVGQGLGEALCAGGEVVVELAFVVLDLLFEQGVQDGGRDARVLHVAQSVQVPREGTRARNERVLELDSEIGGGEIHSYPLKRARCAYLPVGS